MAREFVLGGDGLTTVSAVVTLVGFLPSTAAVPDIWILRMMCGQVQTSAIMQRVQVVTQASVYPTVATATPKALKLGDTNVSSLSGIAGTLTAGHCGINASAEGAGTKTVLWGDVFNSNNGYLWVPTPREVLDFPNTYTSSFGLYLPVAPNPNTGWAANIIYAEGQ